MASDFTVDRASKKYVLNSDGFLKEYANDEPAIEFNADGSYKGVLVEPQSTNLITYSEDFSSWTPLTPPTLTNNYGTSPDGLQNSTRIVGTTGNRIYLPIIGSSATYTYSIYAKGSGNIKIRDNTGTYFLDISLTSEWARYYFTFTASYTNVQIQINTTTDGEIWGAQLEESPIATSYIPTNGSTVPRVKDDIYLTSASSLIGQTEGTLYCEFIFNTESDVFIIANALNGTTDYVGIFRSASSLFFRIRYNSSNNINFTTPHTIGQRYKVAIAYKSGDTAVFVNGSQVGTTSTTAFSFSTTLSYVEFLNRVFYVSPDDGSHHYQAVALYTSRLTDTECEALTTI